MSRLLPRCCTILGVGVWRAVAIGLLLTAVCGCSKKEEPVPDIVIEVAAPAEPKVEGPNAFQSYARLAQRAQEVSSVGLDVRPTDGNKTKSLRELSPLLEELANATQHACGFHYTLVGPFDPKPHHIGWLQLSRALVWRIERAVEDGEFEAAAQWTVVAMVFGADLCGGDVSDATLGLGVMDGARAAVAPALGELSADSLTALAAGTARALDRMPDPGSTILNESTRMQQAVRALQKAVISNTADEFSKGLYKTSREAVTKLAAMPVMERNEFLQHLIDEQTRIALELNKAALVPGAKRGPIESKLDGDERRIAQQFFTAGGPWLAVRDQSAARSRLLYCTAKLMALSQGTGSAPSNLGDLTASLRTDPYTGIEFGYLPMGKEFMVYSYGVDGKDDRGDSNAARTEPDLLLEGTIR